jgi:hypothetical protein
MQGIERTSDGRLQKKATWLQAEGCPFCVQRAHFFILLAPKVWPTTHADRSNELIFLFFPSSCGIGTDPANIGAAWPSAPVGRSGDEER